VHRLAELCGAVPVDVPPDVHDATVALTSHAPQVLASALAGLLLTREQADQPVPLGLSGPGLADTTRLAASSPALWSEVLRANAAEVAPLLRALAGELGQVAGALESLVVGEDAGATAAVRGFLERGTRGRALVPVKRGDVAEAFTSVRVELAHAPREQARQLVSAREAEVNVEDLRLEHVPGRARGVAELLVGPDAAERLAHALRTQGWHVFMSTNSPA
jgi:prephenate dehydrogenase